MRYLIRYHITSSRMARIKKQTITSVGKPVDWNPHMLLKVKVLVIQLCLTLCDPTGCSPPGSSVQGILQARILEWVAISFSKGSSLPRDQTQVSCPAGRFFIICC